jgi:hypothetical protein
VTQRRTGLVVALAAAALAMAGCGGNDSSGGGPTPFEDDSTGTPSGPATSDPATPAPSATKTAQPPGKRALVIVNPGSYRLHPAVIGFTRTIQEFYKARMTHNPRLMNAWVSTIFYTDNEPGILQAKSQGLVMRPPGRVVVRGVRRGPIAGSVTVDTCFGPTMAWYDPKKKRYTNDLPNGSPISMDLQNSGSRWEFYQARLGRFSCASAKYPAG